MKITENQVGVLTKLLLLHLLIIVVNQTLYQMNAMRQAFYSVVYADYLICMFMNINGNTRSERKITEKLRGYSYKITQISTAKYPRVVHLVSYQNALILYPA